MIEYRGITHPFPRLVCNKVFQSLWKHLLCSRQMHLFDEVSSLDLHYLYCDVCGLNVYISDIEEEAE